VDARLTPEQRALRDAAARLVADLGPGSVLDLDDTDRRDRLEKALATTGWRTLRSDGASAVETALVAEELARGLADVPFLGPVLADELLRHLPDVSRFEDGAGPATLSAGGVVLEPRGARRAIELRGTEVLATDVGPQLDPVDLTRPGARPAGDATSLGHVTPHVATRWHALALVLTTADLLGAARGAHQAAVGYARTRRQYGRSIGSYQGVSHPLAEGLALIEGSVSVLRYAAWAVDEPGPGGALVAARAAKVYAARAARTVCETAVQVHGGIGNTWECLAHVYLRRALASAGLFPVRLSEAARGLP
jgi:alkylation response protein AidB-like acyl-CoA dehydrogenase